MVTELAEVLSLYRHLEMEFPAAFNELPLAMALPARGFYIL
ncbi:hypothetical protein [Nostoc sp.]